MVHLFGFQLKEETIPIKKITENGYMKNNESTVIVGLDQDCAKNNCDVCKRADIFGYKNYLGKLNILMLIFLKIDMMKI